MRKKNDTELMNEFNDKYSKLSHGDFIDSIMDNHNDCRYTRIYKKILNSENFSECKDWDKLISIKSSLTRFNPTESDLKRVVLNYLKLVQVEIDKHPGVCL